jgi:hypothetical protein
MTALKLKVSLTLSADLVALVDRDAERHRDTRSGVVEQWLRQAASASVEQEITQASQARVVHGRGVGEAAAWVRGGQGAYRRGAEKSGRCMRWCGLIERAHGGLVTYARGGVPGRDVVRPARAAA